MHPRSAFASRFKATDYSLFPLPCYLSLALTRDHETRLATGAVPPDPHFADATRRDFDARAWHSPVTAGRQNHVGSAKCLSCDPPPSARRQLKERWNRMKGNARSATDTLGFQGAIIVMGWQELRRCDSVAADESERNATAKVVREAGRGTSRERSEKTEPRFGVCAAEHDARRGGLLVRLKG